MTLKRKIVLLLIILAVTATGGSYLIDRLLQVDTYKTQIIAALQRELQREVTYESGKFSLRYGPAFSFSHVAVLQKAGNAPLLTAKRLTFRIALLPLLEKKITLKGLQLDEPTMLLVRESSGAWNIDDLLEQKKQESPLKISGLRIKDGKLRIIDRKVVPAMDVTLEDMQLSLRRLARGQNCSFRFSSQLAEGGKTGGTVALNGTVKLSPAGIPLRESFIDAHLETTKLDSARFWPYYASYVPFKKPSGQLTINGTFKGMLSGFASTGTIRVQNLVFDYPQVFHSVLSPQDVRIRYDLELTPRDLDVKTLDMSVDAFRVKGSCALRDIHSNDLRITARATTAPFQLEKYRAYIPYGIIVDDTADFIEQHIMGGIYRLDEGTLDGRVSQIAHMERDKNYNVLYIRGRVEKGIVSYGSGVPVFNDIAGELEMKGKDFNLTGMSGKFGSSPFTLDGKITDYPLNQPSGYPFTMIMSPRQPEVAWLFDGQKTGKLTLSGPSTLKLAGDGYTSGYNLSGDWELTPAAFSYPGIVTKQAGRPNHLNFKGSINREEAKVTSLNGTLGPLSVAASAKYRYVEKQRLAFELRTNRFQAGEVAPFIPKLAQYHPAGMAQAAINGTSKRNDIKSIQWAGEVSFANASFSPTETVGALTNVTGTVTFNGDTLQTSYMTVRLGSSVLSGRGTLTGFSNPEFVIDFTSPLLSLPDLGLRAAADDVRISQVSGNIALKNNNLHIRSVAAKINDSTVRIRGSITDLRSPKAELSVDAPFLDIGDVLALTRVEPVKKDDRAAGHLALKATVSADAAKAGSLSVEKLHAAVSYEDNILYLQPIDCSLYGGRASAKGRFDITSSSAPRHQISCVIEGASTERLARALAIDRHGLSGKLFLSGDLTARGSTSDELKKTALGAVHLRIEDGSIRKFPVLSKVFSILNVSQLLKGQLPEMVSGGMPFKKITGTLAVRDGKMTTQDLFIDSNAINVSAVGTVDLVRNELDATIGVQPLQTVDKVVNRLPIVGWILTGDNNAFLTAYFEAKGKIDDPSVRTIPVKSMSKGAFNIFKRLFQLPAKLFTDTGEVILGK